VASVKLTQQEFDRLGVRGSKANVDTSNPPFKLPGNQSGIYALGRLKTGDMNKTEAAYDAYLWSLRGTEFLWHKFEGIKLRLADNTFLTVDFPVLRASTRETGNARGQRLLDGRRSRENQSRGLDLSIQVCRCHGPRQEAWRRLES
jgi:hypothetical protein